MWMIQTNQGITRPKSCTALLLLLLSGGLCDTMPKFYIQFGDAAFENQFLFFAFLSALICSILAVFREKQHFGMAELLFGLLIGVPNFCSARFLLLAVSHMPAVVAYPTYSAGTIIAAGLAGVLLFHEPISRRWAAAMSIIFTSIVLLNL